MSQGPLVTKSFEFASGAIELYKQLVGKKEFILSKQFLRSATSIGANVQEAQGGLTGPDFSAKISTAYKEGRETSYWLRLLHGANYIDAPTFRTHHEKLDELNRVMYSILKSTGRIR